MTISEIKFPHKISALLPSFNLALKVSNQISMIDNAERQGQVFRERMEYLKDELN